VKCEVCGVGIKTGIMDKMRGTYIKKGGKLYPVCNRCQKEGEGELRGKIG
jgi:hypothetical protein